MFSHKFVIVLCVLGAVKAYQSNNTHDDDLKVIDSIRNESPCLSQGGMCVIATDCEFLTEQRGLCPEQQSQGIECCYGPSVKETRCQKRGGGCMSSCHHDVIDSRATDCPTGTFCCALVN